MGPLMVGWEGSANPSYDRHSAPQSFAQGGRSLPDVARDGSVLDWQEWLNGDWQPPAAEMSSSPTTGGVAAWGMTSLSQQQLHTQSTAREYGPAALGLFRRPTGSRSIQRANYDRHSASPTLMRVGFRGHMQQRATTFQSGPNRANMNQGEWGAAMMKQSAGDMPRATWQGNRRLTVSADGRAPALAPLGQRSRRASPSTQQQHRTKRQEELRQRRLQKQEQHQKQKQEQQQKQKQKQQQQQQQQEQQPVTGATLSKAPPQDSSKRCESEVASPSAPAFDDNYSRKMALKAECNLLIKEGDTLLTQYANCCVASLQLSRATQIVVGQICRVTWVFLQVCG